MRKGVVIGVALVLGFGVQAALASAVLVQDGIISGDSLNVLVLHTDSVVVKRSQVTGPFSCHESIRACVQIYDSQLRGSFNFDSSAWTMPFEIHNSHFKGLASFRHCKFEGFTWFHEVTFEKKVDFEFAKISSWMMDFRNCVFLDTAIFSRVVLAYPKPSTDPCEIQATFDSSRFFGPTYFHSIICSTGITFNQTEFNAYTGFAGAQMLKYCGFWGTRFNGYADFASANLCKGTAFFQATLGSRYGSWPFGNRRFAGSFSGASLKGVIFTESQIGSIDFEPSECPESVFESLTLANGIKYLCYQNSSVQLASAKKFFRDNYDRQEEREVTCALRRHNQSMWEWLAFDVTCEYGSNLLRPVLVFLLLVLVFGVVYLRLFLVGRRSGLFIVRRSVPDYQKQKGDGLLRLPHHANPQSCGFDSARFKLPSLIGYALVFSLIGALNIGFRDVNFGRAVRLLFKRPIEFEAFGWVRVVSGIQAILSVGLLALWVVSYFGRPFD
jgi:hypothetical protein